MRISTTTLEQFRLFLTEDWMTEEKLLDSIRGVFVPTPQMEAGSAYHAIIESPEKCWRAEGIYESNGRRFPADTVAPFLELVDRSGPFEVKATKVYKVKGRDVTVVGQVDQLCGRWIKEHKTKWAAFDYDRYASSYQWKFYLDIFEGACGVCYHVACLDEDRDGNYVLDGVHTLRLYPYVGMKRDLMELLERFVDYVERREWGGYLLDKAA